MSFGGFLVVTTIVVAVTTPSIGQIVDISSELSDTGRNFSCVNEVVTYSCNGTGAALFVNAPSIFNHIFTTSADIPDAVIFPTTPNVELILRRLVPTFLANINIRVVNDTRQMRLNVTCSTDRVDSSNTLPLILESQIEPPSTVMCKGLTEGAGSRSVRVLWTPPVNPQFDIASYLVRVYVNKVLNTTRTALDNLNFLDVDVAVPSASALITADVRIVTTCGSISAASGSSESVSVSGRDTAFYAGFLVSTIIALLLVALIVVLAILLVRTTLKLKVQDNKKSVPMESAS